MIQKEQEIHIPRVKNPYAYKADSMKSYFIAIHPYTLVLSAGYHLSVLTSTKLPWKHQKSEQELDIYIWIQTHLAS